MSSKGHSEKDIARALGMSASTWTRIKDENPEAQDALDAGRSRRAPGAVRQALRKSDGGDIVALLFLLKCRHGYRETLDITQTNAVQIVFQIPAALDPAEYAKLITKAPHG